LAATLEEMVRKGVNKLRAKADSMRRSWEGARARMTAGYDATPFGPTRKANYRAGLDGAVYRTDPDKWERNWPAKMRE
jgi:hypothetical protein